MRGSRAAMAALLWCALAVLSPPAARADTEDDAKVVHCLSPTRRDALRQAAEALETRPEADLAQWRKHRPDDFERACDALYTAQKSADPGWFANLLPFLTGLFSAAAAFAFTTWQNRVSRGRVVADALSTAVTEFREAADAYLRSWTAGRSDADVVAKRHKLVDQLAKLRSQHPAWQAPGDAITRLTDGPLGDALSTGWGREQAANRKRREECAAALIAVRDDVFAIAAALTRPLRGRR
ncbi:hypothetical protein [Saccharothrix obliqua]|uniref:hypothetical protein n=1 Tax=Saccharothrix obliqua TaxID=2861747 RepID=UPI001C5F95E9|nr:hypothetical protein [Saccharothrix obliqua]MBW4718170.1 hypothetical protein [Saccharothrix obliqua]